MKAIRNFIMLVALLCLGSLAWPIEARAESTVFTCYGEVSVGANFGTASAGGLSVGDRGYVAGPGFGCDVRLASFVVGGLARYDWTDTLGSNGQFMAAGRVGWQLNQYVMPYALLGVTNASYDFGYGSKSTNALMYGLGLQVGLMDKVSLRLEWDRSSFDSQTFDSPVKISPDTDVIRIGLTYDLFGASF